jgi:lipoprotein-anchoring transpeptidase ErfK/SrfK
VQIRRSKTRSGLPGRTTIVLVATATLLCWQPSGATGTIGPPSGTRVAKPEDRGTIVAHVPPRPSADRPPAGGHHATWGTAVAAAAARAADTALPARSGDGRRIVYSISRQRVWLVRGGRQVERTYLVSGDLGQPASGTYRVYSKSRHTRSAVSPERMEHMVRFAHGRHTGAPIGFHSIPVHISTGRSAQRLSQLGTPLSAGCVRQGPQDAAHLWRFASVGAKVVVTR